MSRRQTYIGIAGLLLGLIGLAALWFPVYLDQFDHYGMKISCGNGIGSHIAQTQVDGDAAARCGTALLVRRMWAIPTVALGGLLFAVFLVLWARDDPNQQDEAEEGRHYVPHPEIAGPTTGWWNGSGRIT